MTEESIAVVGGGIIGLAIAREFIRRRPEAAVQVFEKEARLGQHQTGHNSGVVHAGIYYKPGSLKASLCTRGRLLLRDFCAEHGVPYDECGKLVVAVTSEELPRLEALRASATANQVPGLRWVDAEQIREIEPHTTGLAALHSPQTAITDYVAVCEALAADVQRAGGRIRLSTPVVRMRRSASGVEVHTDTERHRFDRVVVCAGLQADRMSAQLDGLDGPRIIPFRGEYLRVDPAKQDYVRGLVYPVPDPRYPFLGVHFTRRVTGELEIGPNAVLALGRESYRRTAISVRDLRSVATWPGSWRMARHHWRTGLGELHGSMSVRAYMQHAVQYVPDIDTADVRRSGAGIRAQAIDKDGTLADDFRITYSDNVTAIRNAPSPAATSSLAIAEYVLDQLQTRGGS